MVCEKLSSVVEETFYMRKPIFSFKFFMGNSCFFYGSPRFISFFYLNIMVKYNAEYIYLVAVSDFDVFYIFFFTQPLNLQVHKGYIVFSVCLGSYFFL